MEDLIRFILARPAQRADTEKGTVETQLSRDLDKALKDAKASNDPVIAVRRVATAHAGSPGALHSIGELKHGVALQGLFGALSGGADKSLNELVALVKKLFAAAPPDVVADAGFRKDREHLSDTLITNAILGREPWVPSDDAARLLRATAIVARVAASDADLAAKGGVAQAIERTIVLPGDLFPLTRHTGPTPAPPARPPETDPERQRSKLRTERVRLVSTYMMLTRVTPDHIAMPEVTELGGERPLMHEARASLPPIIPAEAVEMAAEEPRRQVTGTTGLALRRAGSPLVLKSSVVAAIGERERTVLEERQLDLTRISLPTVVDRLSVELQEVELELAELEGVTHKAMTKIGMTYVDAAAIAIGGVVIGGVAAGPSAVPTTHGSIAPAGIGDLLVVKQFLKRYEARELAHVENVLLGEFKERMHRRARTTEETITVETEVKREEERDQQTTERFELKMESSQIQKEDTSLKIGLAISGKYGPVVEFKASTDFALNTSKEEASKVATSYSKDITTRATSRIFERRREERILKTIEVFEEKNTHGLDNKGGASHVIGQYQWIDKIYEAQVYNYGKRLLFDIMLPEPGAFLLHASAAQPKAGADLVKPLPFTLKPTDLSEWNYAYYVKQYEVVGVTPPPQPYLTVAKALEGKGGPNMGDHVTKTLEIPLTDNYMAVGYEWDSRFNYWENPNGTLTVVVLPEPINGKVGTVTLAVKTWRVEAFTVSLAVHCRRTDRALDEWKLKTHAAILQAYQKQLRDYEEKLAALEVQAAQQIQGRNPVENERLIRTELKKGSTSVFTLQHYDLFGAIALSPQGYPQPDLPEAEAEGKYIRFFEQAFEWEQMMYFFYPYFWGRKPNWLKRALLQDVDPLFAEFIKAGSARVVISVRPGFEKAIAHFLDTGQIWDGGDLPDISSPLYVSIIEEIRERDKAPGAEIVQGDPWDVRLPTTLVILRDQAGLPAWQKNAQGEWVPA